MGTAGRVSADAATYSCGVRCYCRMGLTSLVLLLLRQNCMVNGCCRNGLFRLVWSVADEIPILGGMSSAVGLLAGHLPRSRAHRALVDRHAVMPLLLLLPPFSRPSRNNLHPARGHHKC